MIESRKQVYRLGLLGWLKGDNTAAHTVRRRITAQAKCEEAGPGSESGAKDRRGVLESWESHTEPMQNDRSRTTPVYQRPGARNGLSKFHASETWKAAKDSAGEGNRSERGNGSGSLSGLIVAIESRRTEAGGSL